MSHEVETMAYAGETPWHGLGVPVRNDLTPLQMQKKAGLDWEVGTYPMYSEVNGQRVGSDKKALVRLSDMTHLSTVGAGWNPVQNSTAFEFFHDYVMAGDMEMHTAGSLLDGQMTWVLAKVSSDFELFGGDVVESYLLFSNPHMYGKSIDIRFTPIRVVCNNTLTMSLEGKANRGFRMGHRSKFDTSTAKETLGLAQSRFDQYRDIAEFLGSKRTTEETLTEYFATVFPKTSGNKEVKSQKDLSRNAQLAMEILPTQPGAEYAEGSFWQAFNAVTHITDHLQGRTQEARLYNSWYGSNQDRKVKALNKALKLAEKA